VDAADILRVIMQFLREQGLLTSLKALQDESGVGLTAVDDVDVLAAEVLAGRWDLVLHAVAALQLPPAVVSALYEQVVRELAEAREIDTARALMRSALPLLLLKREEPQRYVRLEHLLGRPVFDATEAYLGGSSKEEKRAELAAALRDHVTVAPPARLVTLLGQALKWQQFTGALPPGGKFDVMRGAAPPRRDAEDKVPTSVAGTVKFGAAARPECVAFSPDGAYLVAGSSDGIIEVYDPETARLRTDLAYQAKVSAAASFADACLPLCIALGCEQSVCFAHPEVARQICHLETAAWRCGACGAHARHYHGGSPRVSRSEKTNRAPHQRIRHTHTPRATGRVHAARRGGARGSHQP
jgi:WD40 repeat-containing protein SMU1